MFTLETKQFTNEGTIVTKVTNLETNKVLYIEHKGSIYGNNVVKVYDEKHFNLKVEHLTSDWRVKLRNIEESRTVKKLSLSKLFYRYENNLFDTYFDNAIEVSFLNGTLHGLNMNNSKETEYVVYVNHNSTLDFKESILKVCKVLKNYEPDMVLFLNQNGNNEIKVSDNRKRLTQNLKVSNGSYELGDVLYIKNLDKDYESLYEFFSNTDEGETEEYTLSGTSDKVKLIHV